MSKLEFRELVALAKIAFEKTKSITYERSKLFTRTEEAGETLESFHAALTAQAAKEELDTLKDELVRGLFILRMKNAVLQDSLTFEIFPLDEVLKRAIKYKDTEQTQTDDTSLSEVIHKHCRCRKSIGITNKKNKNPSWRSVTEEEIRGEGTTRAI